MPSTDAYEAVMAFLDGDGGDIRIGVNAEQAGLLVAGSVYTSRGGRGRQARQVKTAAVTVELVPQNPGGARPIGIGFVERDVVIEAKCTLRRKAVDRGDAQLDVVEDVQRALLFRYSGRSNLAIAGINFRRCAAEPVAIDENPQSSEIARSVTRLVFTHSEALEANA